MSLINDALKRASTNPKPAASAVSAAEPPMVAVAASALAAKPRQGTPVAMIVGMVALTAVAAWFFLKWREASTGQPAIEASSPARPAPTPAAKIQAPPAAVIASTPTAPAPVPIKPAQQTTAAAKRPESTTQMAPKAQAPAVLPTATPVASQTTSALPASTPTPPQPESMPELKLQAIVFRMKNPSALINGHHVEVGDNVSGARVAEIQRTTVVVEWQGKRQSLQIK